MRLLVVEDDSKMADLLRRALVRDGYAVGPSVVAGNDGPEGGGSVRVQLEGD
jgi:DNA-binding response OmpR family regulator